MRVLLTFVAAFAALALIENISPEVAGFIGLGALIGAILGLLAVFIKLIRSI